MSNPEDIPTTSGEGLLAHENERAEAMETRFAGLEDASRILSGDVKSLVATIQVVADLQVKQREQSAKQAAIEHEMRQQREEVDARDARTRKALRYVTISLAILLPVVAILVYSALIVHVNNLIDANKASSYASCNLRNQNQLENADRERALATVETNPQAKAIHVKSANQLAAGLADCSRWAPKK